MVTVILFAVQFVDDALDFTLALAAALALAPFALASAYALKIALRRDGYDDVAPRVRHRELVVAVISTVYTLFLLWAAGYVFWFLACLLLAPATLLYVAARREQRAPLFTAPGLATFVGVAVSAVVGAVLLATGAVQICATHPGGDIHVAGDVRRPLGGRHAPQGARVPAGAGARAPDPEQQRRAAVRRRPVGAEREAGPPGLRAQAARPRGRGGRAARPARRDPPGAGRQGVAARPQDRRERGRPRPARRHARVPRVPRRRDPHRAPRGRAVDARPARRLPLRVPRARARVPGRQRVPHAPAAQHDLHARHDVLDLRRRDAQPAVLARTARRDAAHEGGLRVPPGLHGQHRVVGRPGALV